jgi:hypothetical protein
MKKVKIIKMLVIIIIILHMEIKIIIIVEDLRDMTKKYMEITLIMIKEKIKENI